MYRRLIEQQEFVLIERKKKNSVLRSLYAVSTSSVFHSSIDLSLKRNSLVEQQVVHYCYAD
jgi:hypothetical protein